MESTGDPLVGQRVGNIRLGEPLGEGGMGTVYAGYDERLERRVAVKAIRSVHRFRPDVKARFLREARILSQLNHPRICTVHDYLEGEEHGFLVLELVEGRSLRQLMREGMAHDLKTNVARQLLDVLEVVHGHGVIHRDLKPENVMVSETGDVKVLDFGLARSLEDEASEHRGEGGPVPGPTDELDETGVMGAGGDGPMADDGTLPWTPDEAPVSAALRTRLGTVLGTVGYMSPEQARGEVVTPASDIYSLGLVLQEMFTERPVVAPGLSPIESLLRAASATTIPVDGLPPDLTELLNRMKSPAPGARPSAMDAKRMLQAHLDRPRRRRRRAIVAAIWMVLIAFAGGMAVQSYRAVRAARDADAQRVRAVVARDQAEELMSFMLTDLAKDLEPVGRLALLEDVANTALEYFQSLPDEDVTDAARRQRSITLRQVGTVLQAQGDLASALAAYQEAREVAGDLAATAGDPADRMEFKDSLDDVGIGLFGQGKYREALAAFQQAADLAIELVGEAPEDPEPKEALAYTSNALGIVYRRLGETQKALANYQRSLDIRTVLAEGRGPDDPAHYAIATSLLNIGVLHWELGDPREAITCYQGAVERLEALLEHEPDNMRWVEQLALIRNNLGVALGEIGDLEGNLEVQRAALATMERLCDHDPSNASWQRDRAIYRANIGATLWELGRFEEALADQLAALALSRELAGRDPSNAKWRTDVSTNLSVVASTHRQLGDSERSLAVYEEARQWNLECSEDFPDNPICTRNLADAWHGIGTVLLNQGRGSESLAAHRQAVRLRAELVERDPENRVWARDHAVALTGLGNALLAIDDHAEALTAFAEALAGFEVLDSAAGARPLERVQLAEALIGRGQALEALGRPTEARASWQRAVDLTGPGVNEAGNSPQLAAFATASLLLGETEGLDEAIARLDAAGRLDAELRELAANRGL